MFSLNGLEEVAYIRLEELRRQGDRARFLRKLPRNEGVLQRGMRAVGRMLHRYPPVWKAQVYSPGVPERLTEARNES